MASIKVPELFRELLEHSEYAAAVATATERVSAFFNASTRGLPFFPEYTDHGAPHVQRVLDSAVDLITTEAVPIVSSADAATLTMAVLLHDSAMHLSEDSFLTLISSADSPLLSDFDDAPWSVEWERYYREATHWDDRQLFNVLGDATDPASDLAKWIRPVTEMGSPDTWDTKYRKLIGEFIRRHHARLAHEFAVAGVPEADSDSRLELLDGSHELRDLAGLIARSHNHSLRHTFRYLQTRFHSRVKCHRTHPVYLMVLLRIGDYLQVEADRTPSESLRVRTLRNSISRAEWKTHLSINDVRQDDEDVEAVFVVSNPTDARTFLKVRSLLDGLQSELDSSWAVLGEVFSRQGTLKNLGIKLRRVRSNIDDVHEFRKRVEYLPAKFSFETAGAALLNKLIGPLYGDNPEIGVRELLQNAIDAVNELRSSEHVVDDDGKQPIRIAVEKRSGEFWLTVEDFGIGMEASTLQSFFLRAGATYRESDAWRRSFASDGNPKVLRSGRFGVGVLAAFLLGNRVEVKTRHVTAPEEEALSFSSSIRDEVIEVRRCNRQRPGTTIAVKLDDATYETLKKADGKEWDWYRWTDPSVARSIDDDVDLPLLTRLPAARTELPPDWHRLQHGVFDEVLWTLGRAPALVCNGLNIGNSASSSGPSEQAAWYSDAYRVNVDIRVPSVSVTDRRGMLPLNLQRNGLLGKEFPFRDELMTDVTSDFCAFCLVFAPNEPLTGDKSRDPRQHFNYPGRSSFPSISFHFNSQWFYARDGAGVLNRPSLSQTNFDIIHLLLALDMHLPFPSISVNSEEALCLGHLNLESFPSTTVPMALAHMLGRDIEGIGVHHSFFTRNAGVKLCLPNGIARMFDDLRGPQIDLTGLHRGTLRNSARSEDISVWSTEEPGSGNQVTIPQNCFSLVASGAYLYAQIAQPQLDFNVNDAFSKTWKELLPHAVVPYDRTARREKFSATYERLHEFVMKWEALKELGIVELKRRFRLKSPEGHNEKF